MDNKRPSVLRAIDVTAQTSSVYPVQFTKEIQGREKRALGDAFGLTQYGVNLATLAPGSWSAQRHWHEVEDEFIYVVDGEITLVDNDGEHLLSKGMCVGFKAGTSNAHKLVNKSAKPASYLEVGLRSPEERVTYPDVDLKGVKSGGKFSFSKKDGTLY
jgi:uncharacterized cupin superfamily protein